MRELIALAAAFLIIIALLYKSPYWHYNATAAVVMGFIAGFTPLEVVTAVLKSIMERPTVELFAVIA